MRITLLRHGKPAFELKGSVQSKALGRIAEQYRLTGISDSPPKETIQALQQNHLIVCSSLIRSKESVRALGFEAADITDPLFEETPIPHFSSGSLRMPVMLWMVLLRVLWRFGFARNGESYRDARSRAQEAALTLIRMAEQHHRVLLVGHGFINHFIAKELRTRGWAGPSKPGKGYWDYACYERSHA